MAFLSCFDSAWLTQGTCAKGRPQVLGRAVEADNFGYSASPVISHLLPSCLCDYVLAATLLSWMYVGKSEISSRLEAL